MGTKDIINVEQISNAALRVLHYYAIFRYPLKASEIYGSYPEQTTLSQVKEILNDLLECGEIYEYKGYYSPCAEIETLVSRREKGNALAIKKTKEARKAARIISHFPFVRFVGISGSLSKGYAEQDSDFDFFIVTASNRLWICRTLLHLFKKFTFLSGSQHHFCMNYFVDTNKLQIEEKNRYTATELASLIPVYGIDTSHELMNANSWINNYFPNGYVHFNRAEAVSDTKNIFRVFSEVLINLCGANSINKFLMRITDKKWQRKWRKKNYPAEDYGLAFKTTLHISKNHPANYQKKILSRLSN